MLGTPFYHNTIRNITVAIGTLFNDIHVIYKDATDTTIKDKKVPLAYAPRSGYWSKMNEDLRNATHDVVQSVLPRLSFDFEGPTYDPTRQLNPMNKLSGTSLTSNDFRSQVFQPIPYNFAFNLTSYSNRVDDSLQVMEQVLPFFTPQYNLTIKEIDENGMLINRDVPIVLEGVTKEDNYEEGFVTNRLISWSFSFTVRGYVYHRVSDARTIKKTLTTLYNDEGMTSKLESIGVDVNPLTAGKDDIWSPLTTITIDPSQLG